MSNDEICFVTRGELLQEDHGVNVSQSWREEFGVYLKDCHQ